jgi:hypothetical protein
MSWRTLRCLSSQPRRRRRGLKTGRAGIKVATASTQTQPAVEPKASITTVFAAVSAGRPRKRHHVHHRRSASTGARSQKSRCKDCGTGYCEHGRQKSQCKGCGTGYCEHGRQKSWCMDCGTGYCEHGRQKRQCKDCGKGYCEHGRQKRQCKGCR